MELFGENGKQPVGLTGQRILITGGTGFIGTALAARLCRDNQVVLLDRSVEGTTFAWSDIASHPNVSVIPGSVLDQPTVEQAVRDMDYVVHMAALLGVNMVRARARETIETNLLGTWNVLKALENGGGKSLKRFVFFSTSEVFGTNSFRVGEDVSSSVGPVQEARWSYSISKLAGEHLVQSFHREVGLPTVTIRPFNVFGPGRLGDHAMLRFIVAALAHTSLIVHGNGDQIRSWCYVDDFVNGVLAAMQVPEAVGEDFNLGNPRNTLTIYELARRIIALTASRSEIQFEEPTYTDIDVRVPRMDKAVRLLRFQPVVEMDEGIRRTIAWCGIHYDAILEALAAAPPPVCAADTRLPLAVISRRAVGDRARA